MGDRFISPDVQERRCRDQAKADGREIGLVFIDLDQSGGKASRPEFDKVMARVEGRESAGIYVFDLSRFGRSTRNVLDGIDLIESHGGKFVSCAEKIDTSTSTGRFVTTIFAALRQMEREQSAERWKTATGLATERGAFVGRTPVGYERLQDGTLVKNDDAKAVASVFYRRVSGWSWNRLAEGLEAAGVKTATGQTSWHRNSVRSLVQHPIYKGTLKNGIVQHVAAYAVVAPSVWESAQEKKGVNPGRRDGGAWALLSGLVFCNECGAALTPQRDRRGGAEYRAYRCQNRACKKALGRQVRAQGYELDALAAELALDEYARRISLIGLGSGEDVLRTTALEQELAAAEYELAQYLAIAKASLPGFAQGLEERSAAVENVKAAITEEQAKTRRYPSEEEVRALLADGSIEEKREAVRRVVLKVKVAAVGDRLKDEFRSQPWTAEQTFPPQAYEPSSALEDRIETLWRP